MLRIDIVSDVVCPWCVIGFKQLERALADTGHEAEVYWHPFELNPPMGPEGQGLREHVAEKYGTTAADSQLMREKIAALGESLGFTFAFDDNSRIYNTFQAHQLLHWAGERGKGNDLKQALFTAYFTDQKDVSDPQVLIDVAGGVGLDTAEAKTVLEDGRYIEDVRGHQQFWTSRGITGVPAMVFDSKHLVTGAQGTENYANILNQLAAAAE